MRKVLEKLPPIEEPPFEELPPVLNPHIVRDPLAIPFPHKPECDHYPHPVEAFLLDGDPELREDYYERMYFDEGGEG